MFRNLLLLPCVWLVTTVTAAGQNFLTGSLNLADLNGQNGFVLNGIDPTDLSGRPVAGAGDVNGDGIDDVIIGAYQADPGGNNDAGESYVVFGSRSGFAASFDLADLNGQNGFVLNGIDAGDQSGVSVHGAGDVNGDGIDDLIIGAYQADPGGNPDAGESYLVFGSQSGFAASFDLADLNGQNGFVLNGIDLGDQSGVSVRGAGDVNGDGIHDVIIGAFQADPGGNNDAGESYVVFGSQSGFAASFDLADLNGQNGFVLNGIDAGDQSGVSVHGAGDVNGDGIDDLIIGAYQADPGGNPDAGESYLVFGSQSGFAASFDLADLNGQNGFVLNGIDAGDASGLSVRGAGDVNGDGIDDVVIGAYAADPGGNTDAGESYVVFGSQSGFAASFDLADLNGQNGFVLNGIDAGDQSGVSVHGAGDVNGDGIDDLIIGAELADPGGNSEAGESYVVFGIAGFTWTPLAGGEFDTATNWLGGEVPTMTGGTVIIEPRFGGIINGPIGAVFADHLVLAADSGILTFDIPATGLLLVRQPSFTLDSSVRLTGDGTFGVDGDLENFGEIDLGNGGLQVVADSLSNAGLLRGVGTLDAPVTNLGRIEAVDQIGELDFRHLVTNDLTGLIAIRNSAVRFRGGLANSGQMSFGNGGGDVYGNVTNSGQISFGDGGSDVYGNVTNSGTIALSGEATVSLVGNLDQNQTLNLLAGSRLIVFEDVTGTGGSSGSGTLEVLGSLSPGSSLASVSFGGDVILGPSSAARFELAGVMPGNGHDQLEIAADVLLAGTLQLEPITPYVDPVESGAVDTFAIISAGNVEGAFDEITYDGTLLDETFSTATTIRSYQGDGLFRVLEYLNDGVIYSNYRALGGDANGDGTVDGQDFIIWNASKFTSGTNWITGDFTGDGITDGQDFILWNQNKFTSVQGFAAYVPEPHSWTLLILFWIATALSLRR